MSSTICFGATGRPHDRRPAPPCSARRRVAPVIARRPTLLSGRCDVGTTGRARLDRELVRRGLVASRQAAQELITSGNVTVDGAPGRKPATLVAPQQQLAIIGPGRRWVSRGGDKLDGALDTLAVPVAGSVCLDAGASTGGFTDVLLARGARTVIAVDVGYGQLAWRLRRDPRVIVVERTHVRDLATAQLAGHIPTVVVADLSFISLRSALPPLHDLLGAGVDWCCLVKPQFEVGSASVGRRGVVRDADAWGRALDGVRAQAHAIGLVVTDGVVSDLPGPAGNVEFFLWLRDDGGTEWAPVRARMLQQGSALRDRAAR